MREYETMTDLPENREITIQLPQEFRPGKVTLSVVQQQDEDPSPANDATRKEQFALLNQLRANRKSFRSKEEIDPYIEEERNSWD